MHFDDFRFLCLLAFFFCCLMLCVELLMFLVFVVFLRCDCTEKLQSKFDFLRSQLNDISSFKNIYRYAFDFARVRLLQCLESSYLYLFNKLVLDWFLCFLYSTLGKRPAKSWYWYCKVHVSSSARKNLATVFSILSIPGGTSFLDFVNVGIVVELFCENIVVF